MLKMLEPDNLGSNPSVSPQARCLTSCPSFLACEVGTIVKPTPPSCAPGLNELAHVSYWEPGLHTERACILDGLTMGTRRTGEKATSGWSLRPLGPHAGAERLAEARQVLGFEDKADALGKTEDKEERLWSKHRNSRVCPPFSQTSSRQPSLVWDSVPL